MTTQINNKISPLVKTLAAFISLFMLSYGAFIINSQHYYGYTSKNGGAQVSADGIDAMLIGIAIILISLSPMALWAKSGKIAGIWASICMVLGILLFLAPIYMH